MADIYAPGSARKIDEAAHLIRKAVRLLDNAGGPAVIAEIEKIEGTGFVNEDMVKALLSLAERLDT